MTFQGFSIKAGQFLESLFKTLDEKSVILEKHWSIDHLCYRTSSLEQYNQLKLQFATFAELLIESDVNGRPIATYKFAEPIRFRDWSIQVVELPAPKPGKVTVDGFEHIEVVCDISFKEISERYSRVSFDDSGLKKDFNQEFEMPLGSFALKFHHTSLESVIRLEKNTKAYDVLKKSEVLKRFKSLNPLVAGTFPLGLSVDKSDLDILMGSADLEAVQAELTKAYSSFAEFKIERVLVSNATTLIAKFSLDEVPFEIFVQDIEPVQQAAYRHFLIEERILNLGGDRIAQKVRELRQAGLKTEPAFAKALNLSGDGFVELLSLQTKSECELRNVF